MSIVLDIILVAIFIFLTARGWRRGIWSTLLNVMGWIVALALIAGFSESWAQRAYDTAVEPRAVRAVERAIPAGTVEAMNSGADAMQSVQGVLDGLGGFLGGRTVDTSALREIESSLRQDSTSLARAITRSVLAPALLAVVRAVISILIWVVTLALFGLLSRISARRRRGNGVLGAVNRLLGGVLGAAEGVAAAYLYALMLSLFASWLTVSWLTPGVLQGTHLVKMFML